MNLADSSPLQRKLARETAARREAEQLLETKSRELYAANLALNEANHQLSQAREKAEEASAAKSVFIAKMSHELLTPMNAIIGLNQLLLDTPLSSRQREFAQSIGDSAQALLSILNDILEISAIEAGKITLEADWFRVDQLIEDVIAQIAPVARAKGIEIIMDSAVVVGVSLRADRERLGQSLLTLLHNAVKFTECGFVMLRARLVQQSSRDTQLEVSIRDTGIGISDEHKARIFEPFEQVDQGASRRHGGAGLGLTILKHLAGLMGGELAFFSSLGQGSTFVMSIPAAQLRTALAEDARPPELKAVAGRNVLLVDDEPLALDAMAALLRAHDIKVVTAGSASQALALLHTARQRSEPVDLVIADLHLRDEDSIELFGSLGGGDSQSSPRLVCLTSQSPDAVQSLVALTGCQLLLEKPLTARALATDLARFVRSGGQAAAHGMESVSLRPDQSALDMAVLRQMLDIGDVGALEFLRHNEQALRFMLGSNYIPFVTAIKHFDFTGAAAFMHHFSTGDRQ